MKKLFAILGFAAILTGVGVNSASADDFAIEGLTAFQVRMMMADVSPMNLVNWKVGETASYNISLAFGSGTMVKTATKDDGNTLWIESLMDLLGQKQDALMQIDRATAKILKMTVNGQDQQIPDDKPEIISQDYADITVPAGTFKSMHIVAKTKESDHIEVWMNPQATVMEGTLKQIAATQYGDVTLELTSFKKAN